jgi:amino acid transporter
LLIIWSSALLNIIGIVPVGKVSLALSAIVLSPFIVMFIAFFWHHTGPLHFPAPSLHGVAFPSLALGIYTVMWNCLGWDSVTTYAEEVENPIRSYITSVAIAFVAVIGIYTITILVAQQSGINYATLTKEGFPALGNLVSGSWLGTFIAAGGMAGTLGLYNAGMLSVSRLPKAMADDGLLPAKLNKLHPKFHTPYVSIIACSVVISLMILWTFADLLIIDVTIYGAGLFLEYFALIKLRITEPDRDRPFRVPLKVPGLLIMILFPIGTYGLALTGICSSATEVLKPALFALGILLTAEVFWRLTKWRKTWLKD